MQKSTPIQNNNTKLIFFFLKAKVSSDQRYREALNMVTSHTFSLDL